MSNVLNKQLNIYDIDIRNNRKYVDKLITTVLTLEHAERACPPVIRIILLITSPALPLLTKEFKLRIQTIPLIACFVFPSQCYSVYEHPKLCFSILLSFDIILIMRPIKYIL